MKVLYVLGNYPKISETYITAEIAFMRRAGVEIEVWSKREGTPGMAAPVRVHRGSYLAALRTFQPDLVHVHYLIVGHAEIMQAGMHGIPVTIRGHSYDFSEENVRAALRRGYVRRLYLFPHFAARFRGEDRVRALPVAYDSNRYQRHPQKNRALVLRTCVAKPVKGIEDFLRVSALCPNHRFVLLANTVGDDWMQTLREMAGKVGRVEMYEDVPNDEAARWTREAGIYLDTNDPGGHQFGMPISVAEAMATGSLLLMRDADEAVGYTGSAACYYKSIDDAASMIRQTALFDNPAWDMIERNSLQRAALYTDEAVLPTVLEDWRGMCRSRSR